ncbi:MAG: hypothetical protein K6F53_02770, partial [Lachnospiraceae bacterium]|nr:hypothetical protein [Lachnospiraceae bacterium]
SKTGKHNWVPHVVSKASCTSGGIITGSDCTICHKRDWDGHIEWVDRLPHDLDVTTVTRTEPFISETGSSAGTKEVTTVTARCKSCGYNFPKAVYTVTKSPAINKYSVDPGNVTLTDLSDGIHVDQQFGKDGGVYFNKVADGALMEAVNNLLNIYRRKEGSVITEFTQEFMNSLEDGEYEVIQVNGDEIAAATLKVVDHKFVDHPNAEEGKQPGITALSEWRITSPGDTIEDKFDKSEKIVVNGEEVDYYPYMSDGELRFYLGEIENNPAPIDFEGAGEALEALTVRADPILTPGTVEYDGVGNVEITEDSADPEEPLGIRFVKSDKGHEPDAENPISMDGVALPATEEVRSTQEGQETEERVNYRIKNDKITFTREFLDVLGEGEHVFTVNYEDGLQAVGAIAVPPVIEEDQTELTLSSSYVVLEKGEKAVLEPLGLDDAKRSGIVWSIVDADDQPCETVSFSEASCLVTALSEGTCWIAAEYERSDGKGTLKARCRVDVYDPLSVNNIAIVDKKATVELFSTNYAKINISTTMNEPEAVGSDGSALVMKAEFENEAVAEIFDLEVVDDMTLAIVPKSAYVNGDANVLKKLKKTYKSKIKITAKGNVSTTGEVTITLKKSKPKLTASKISLNSAVPDDAKALKFKGGVVTDLEFAKEAPDWIGLNDKELVYTGAEGKKLKGKVFLTAKVRGWAIGFPVSVSVNAAPVAAKVSIGKKSITLTPGCGDAAEAAVKITPAVYADEIPEIVITENGKETDTSELACAYYDRKLHITCTDSFDGSKARTFKITLKLRGKSAKFTVKTRAADKMPSLKVKAAGSINTMIAKSPVTLAVTPVNYNAGAEMTYTVRITRFNAGTNEEEEVTGLIDRETDGRKITLREKTVGSLEKGYNYYAYVKGTTAKGTDTKEVRTKIEVKWPASAPAASVSIKAGGSLDVIRPESSVKVTASVKNYYDYTLTPADLLIYKMSGKQAQPAGTGEANEFFDVSVSGNVFTVKLKDDTGINHLTDKFAVGLKITETLATKKNAAIKIGMGKAKFRQSAKTVVLMKSDKYSRQIVTIDPVNTGLSGIGSTKFASPVVKSTKAPQYELLELGNNEYAIRFAGFDPKAAKSGKVKIKVFLKGNNTAGTKKEKPNAVITVKVNLK